MCQIEYTKVNEIHIPLWKKMFLTVFISICLKSPRIIMKILTPWNSK